MSVAALRTWAPRVAFVLAGALIAFGASDREPLFNDEVINASRTMTGFSNHSENVLDYSLRPAFRLLNQFWVALFGQSLAALWLGAALVAIAMVVSLQRVGRDAGGPALATIAPFWFLATPMSVWIGLSAMPHLPSALAALLATMLIVAWQRRPADAPNRDKRLVGAAFFCAAMALMTHPTQISLVLALGAITAMLVVLALARDGWHLGANSARTLGPVLIGYAVLAAVIGVVELAYRVGTVGATSTRLLPGATFSYLNHWIGNVLQIEGKVPKRYLHDGWFYVSLLVKGHPTFFFSSLALLLVALVVFVRRRAWSRDAPLFIPALVVVLWIIVASTMRMSMPRVLVGITPVAIASNLFLLGYLLERIELARVRGAIVAVALAATSVAAVRVVAEDHREVAEPNRSRRRNVVAPYRLVAGLPPGPFAFVDAPGDNGSHIWCLYFAQASGHAVVRIAPEALSKRRGEYSYLCASPKSRQRVEAWIAKDARAAKYQRVLDHSSIELWVPVPLQALR